MPAPRFARVERKESFPYGARLDRYDYWRLVLPGEVLQRGDEACISLARGHTPRPRCPSWQRS